MNLEQTLLALCWADDECEIANISYLKREWFGDKELYDKVKKYRDERHPFDVELSNSILGIEATKALFVAWSHSGKLPLWSNYLYQFKKIQAQYMLEVKVGKGELKADDLREIIPLLERVEEDERDYGMGKDLIGFMDDLGVRMKGEFEKYNLGIPELDDTLGYIEPKDMIVISGKGGLGKTTFALKIFNNLVQAGKSGVFFSSEMDNRSLYGKLAALNTGINSNKIRNGKITKEELSLIVKKVSDCMYNKPGRIIETLLKSTESFKAKILKHKAKFIIVDNIQRFWIGDMKGINKADYLEELAKRIKDISMEMGIFSIVISQVNDMNEVRGSRGIYNNADFVINLEYVSETEKIKQIKLNIAKSRFSATQSFNFIMDKTTGDFYKEEIIPDKEKEDWRNK